MYEIKKYPDGSSYVTIPKDWEDTTQEIVFRINNYTDLHHLHQLCEVLIWNRVATHIVIPCLLDAQADRRFNEYHSSGLKTIAVCLDAITEGNNISFGFFHPHNPEVVEALFSSCEIVDNEHFIKRVLKHITEDNSDTSLNEQGMYSVTQNLVLMSADAGGFKPLTKLCDNLKWAGQIHSCAKGRNYDGEKSELTQRIGKDDFFGKDILIVDDISVYGGTFKGLSKLLRQRNCGKLYLAVSHMTLQNLGEDPVTNYFDKVFTTNSKFDEYHSYEDSNNPLAGSYKPKNLEVITLF